MARSQDTEERESQEPENQHVALGEVTRRVTRQQTRLTQEAEVAEVGITENHQGRDTKRLWAARRHDHPRCSIGIGMVLLMLLMI